VAVVVFPDKSIPSIYKILESVSFSIYIVRVKWRFGVNKSILSRNGIFHGFRGGGRR
jgi:hypothetical protein